jgi:hypothetical protein
MNDDEKSYSPLGEYSLSRDKEYKDFMHDLEWGNLIDDDLLEPLDADEPIFDEIEEIDEEDYEGL